MTVSFRHAMQAFKRTCNFFLNSTHFSTIFITVAVVGAALFFANITPASLPDSRTLLNLEQGADQYLDKLARQGSTEIAEIAEIIDRPADQQETEAQWPAEYTRIEGMLQSGDTLHDALRRSNIDQTASTGIISALDGLLDFRTLRPRDRYTVVLDQAGELVEYRYEAGPLDVYRVLRTAASDYQAEKMSVTLERHTKKIGGEVTSSLFAAFQPHGEHARLIYTFADIFSSQLDFNVETKTGDRFELIFEKYYQDEQFVGYGRILSARYEQASGEVHEAFRFESQSGGTTYFDRDGNQLGASFLRSPVPMARVSSGFTYRRLHPILNVVRPHLAVDLAAPTGTPVMATADGRVHFAGANGGNGNMVVIEHGNGYRSSYAHLSGFKRGLRVGDRVQQKEIIGYVGSTGLATGPHVCYRIQHHGEYVNPLALRFKPRSVLAGEELAAFAVHVGDITRLASGLAAEKTVLQVSTITINPEERFSLL